MIKAAWSMGDPKHERFGIGSEFFSYVALGGIKLLLY